MLVYASEKVLCPVGVWVRNKWELSYSAHVRVSLYISAHHRQRQNMAKNQQNDIFCIDFILQNSIEWLTMAAKRDEATRSIP